MSITGVMAHEIGHVLGLMETCPLGGPLRESPGPHIRGPGVATRSTEMRPCRSVAGRGLQAGGRPTARRHGRLRAPVGLRRTGADAALTARPRSTSRCSPTSVTRSSDAATAWPELYGYGAWGKYSAWGAGVERSIHYEGGRIVTASDTCWGRADAFGLAPPASLANTHVQDGGHLPVPSSASTWDSRCCRRCQSELGVDDVTPELSSRRRAPACDDLTVHDGGSRDWSCPLDRRRGERRTKTAVFSAELRVEPRSMAGPGVRRSHAGQPPRGQAAPSVLRALRYGASKRHRKPLSRMKTATGNSAARFFGPAHEEMAGVLDDRTLPSTSSPVSAASAEDARRGHREAFPARGRVSSGLTPV